MATVEVTYETPVEINQFWNKWTGYVGITPTRAEEGGYNQSRLKVRPGYYS